MKTRIVINPEILDGKPIIEGTRLSVEHVLGLLASGMSEAEIIADYPELNEENLQAVRAYASPIPSGQAWILRNGVIIDLPTTRDRVLQCCLRLSLT